MALVLGKVGATGTVVPKRLQLHRTLEGFIFSQFSDGWKPLRAWNITMFSWIVASPGWTKNFLKWKTSPVKIT